jgi:hypothetical protein
VFHFLLSVAMTHSLIRLWNFTLICVQYSLSHQHSFSSQYLP